MSQTNTSSSSESSSVAPNNRPSKYNCISSDKKKILIKCYKDGKSISESADISGINKNTAKQIINKLNKNGGVLVEKKRGGQRVVKLTGTILRKIELIVEENPAITLKNIREKLIESENVNLSISTINNGLKALRITLKTAALDLDRRNAPRTIEERKIYALHFSRSAPQAREKILFLDESGFNYHLRRRKARSKINTLARVIVPTTRGRNVSLIAAMSIEGIIIHKIIDNSCVNSNIFFEFLQELFQKLEEDRIEDVWLVMDNAAIHKTQQVRDLVSETTHTLVFLPPYSPMMNPIEEVFSKIKFSARNMLADPANNSNLVDIIHNSVESVTPTNCNNYYLNMSMKLPSAAAGDPL